MLLVSHYDWNNPIPEDGFDNLVGGFDFSIYSPTDVPIEQRISWGTLALVLEEVTVLILQRHYERELKFEINQGLSQTLIGYGHLVSQRNLIH